MRICDEIRERAVPKQTRKDYRRKRNRKIFEGELKRLKPASSIYKKWKRRVQADIKNDEEIQRVFREERERENDGGDVFRRVNSRRH